MICYYIEDIGAVAKCSSERAEVFFIYDASDGWVRDEWNIVPEYLDESEAIKVISEKEMKQRISSGYTFSLKAYLEQNHIEEDNGTIEDIVKEVESLKQEGCCAETPGMKAIGYREFFDSSLKTKAQICSRIKLDSRKYAKKQITFMRGIPQAQKVSVTDLKTIKQLIESFLSEHKVLSEL